MQARLLNKRRSFLGAKCQVHGSQELMRYLVASLGQLTNTELEISNELCRVDMTHKIYSLLVLHVMLGMA